MTLTGINLQSKIARFFNFIILDDKNSQPFEEFIEV